MSEINNVENKASVINVSAPLDYEAIKREWEEIDKLEASLPAEVKRNRKLGIFNLKSPSKCEFIIDLATKPYQH